MHRRSLAHKCRRQNDIWIDAILLRSFICCVTAKNRIYLYFVYLVIDRRKHTKINRKKTGPHLSWFRLCMARIVVHALREYFKVIATQLNFPSLSLVLSLSFVRCMVSPAYDSPSDHRINCDRYSIGRDRDTDT